MAPPSPLSALRRPLATLGKVLAQTVDRAGAMWLATALAVVLAGGLAAGLGPLILARFIDALTARADAPPPLSLALGYGACLLAQRICEQAQSYAYTRGEQRLTRRLSASTFEHLLRLPLSLHLDSRSGALTQTLNDGVIGLRLILTHLILTVTPVVAQLVVAAAVLVGRFDATMALLLASALIAYAVAFARGVARQNAPAKAISSAQIEAGGLTADGLMNVETIKLFGAEQVFARKLDTALGERERHWIGFLAGRLGNGILVGLIFAATITAAMILSLAAFTRGALTLGDVVLLNAYLLQLVRPVELLGFAVRDMGQGFAYLDRLTGLMGVTPEASGRETVSAPNVGPVRLSFSHVSFGFGPERPVLKDISFELPAGETLAIVGPSGGGKSSLLRLILRLHEPDGGEIQLDGRNVADLPLAALRSQIAVVSQDTILFNDSIAENIRLSVANADASAIAVAADTASLAPLLARLPDGLQTPVGERGLKLSGGEKQRVAIARAALRRARLVIFDEATAALDAQTEQAVWRAMADLARSTTTLVVTHRLASIQNADQILVIDQGQVVERGRHPALLAANGAYAELWRAQATT